MMMMLRGCVRCGEKRRRKERRERTTPPCTQSSPRRRGRGSPQREVRRGPRRLSSAKRCRKSCDSCHCQSVRSKTSSRCTRKGSWTRAASRLSRTRPTETRRGAARSRTQTNGALSAAADQCYCWTRHWRPGRLLLLLRTRSEDRAATAPGRRERHSLCRRPWSKGGCGP